MEKEITKNIVKKEIVEYSIKCSKCNKVIIGSTENQVRFNLDTHQKGKGCKFNGETNHG